MIENHSGLTPNQKQTIKKENLYMDVFYRIIDNDESLKRKGENVRFNGIFWTSSADLFLISLVYFILYCSDTLKTPDNTHIVNATLFIFCLSLILHIISVWKHVKLSDEQLKIIRNHYSDTAKEEFDLILNKRNIK